MRQLEEADMIPPVGYRHFGNTDKPLWLLVLKRLEVRFSLWLEYRFWPALFSLFDDRSEIARTLSRAGWIVCVLAVVYLLGHVALAARRGFFVR